VVKYTEIVNEDFRKLLKEFLTWLWDNYDDLPQALKDEYNDVQDHFNEFKKAQKGKVCPFCGISSLKPPTDRKRVDPTSPDQFLQVLSPHPGQSDRWFESHVANLRSRHIPDD